MRRLTEQAEWDRQMFERLNEEYGCACHINPPCTVCTHPGNPANQEGDECWEEVDG